jgi:hypothetical protein
MHLHIDTLHTNSNVFRFRGVHGQDSEEQFKQLVKQRTPNPENFSNE